MRWRHISRADQLLCINTLHALRRTNIKLLQQSFDKEKDFLSSQSFSQTGSLTCAESNLMPGRIRWKHTDWRKHTAHVVRQIYFIINLNKCLSTGNFCTWKVLPIIIDYHNFIIIIITMHHDINRYKNIAKLSNNWIN